MLFFLMWFGMENGVEGFGIIEGELTWVLRFGKGDAEHESLSVITISDNMWQCLWLLENPMNKLINFGGGEDGP